MDDKGDNVLFKRGEVAKILNVSVLTISNREKQGGPYPQPRRDVNNYRIYTLPDVLNLQIITFGEIDTRPIISIMYDKGYRDMKKVGMMIESALSRRYGTP